MEGTRIIKVSDCMVCPLARRPLARDKRRCTHSDTDGMDVEYYDSEIHPDCALPELEDNQ